MEKIPFAQFVANDIEENGVDFAEEFMGGYYYGNKGRGYDPNWRAAFLNDMKTSNDYNFSVDGFFFRTVYLARGNPNGNHFYGIKVKGEDKKRLIAIWDRLEAERHAEIKRKKEERKAAEKAAEWWP